MPLAVLSRLRLEQRVVLIVRGALLLVVSVLTLAQRQDAGAVIGVLALTAVAVAASVPVHGASRAAGAAAGHARRWPRCCVFLTLEPLPESLLPT